MSRRTPQTQARLQQRAPSNQHLQRHVEQLADQLDGLSMTSTSSGELADHQHHQGATSSAQPPSRMAPTKRPSAAASNMPPRAILQRRPPANGMFSLSACDLGVRVSFDPERTASRGASKTSLSGGGQPRAPSQSSSVSSLRRTGSQRNYTFSATQMRDIERTNQILVRKIVGTKASTACVRRTQSTASLRAVAAPTVTAPATVNRRRQQKQIDSSNDLMQKRLMRIATRRSKLAPT